MEVALFIIYLIIFSFAITIIPFYKNSGFGKYTLISLFLIKVASGFAYAKFFLLPQYYSNSDTWRFYRLSIIETDWLLSDPVAFIKDLFTYGYGNSGNLFSGENSYWNDLKSNVMVKIMAVINIATNKSYYASIIFFNFLFLFGLVAIAKVLNQIFPGKKWITIAGIFLLPSTLFWSSGIHKDGLILSATGLVILLFKEVLEKRYLVKNITLLLACLLLVFSLRNYVFFALVPALLCWALTTKFPANKTVIFVTVYSIGICLFFLVPLVAPALNFPEFITKKQHEFLLLEGGSKVPVQILEPAFKSFVTFLPTALDMAFLRPHYNEIKNFSYIPAFVEIVFLLALLFYSAFKINRKSKTDPIVLFLLFFSFTIILLVGYTVPFTSAVVRYRSFAWPFLITPLLCLSIRSSKNADGL